MTKLTEADSTMEQATFPYDAKANDASGDANDSVDVQLKRAIEVLEGNEAAKEPARAAA